MKYYIKQQVFSLSEKFTVKDEFGNDAFFVQGSYFRIPKAFEIFDAHGDRVASIERQLFKFLPKYRIVTSQSDFVLERAFTFFKARFDIVGEPWSLGGDLIGMNYQILSGDKIVMRLRKHWFTWGDSYELDVLDDDRAVEALAIAICIDEELARDTRAASSST